MKFRKLGLLVRFKNNVSLDPPLFGIQPPQILSEKNDHIL